MRIALIHVAQETNDFNPVATTLADFESFGIFEGAAVEELKGYGQVGGYYDVVARSGLEIETVPIVRGFAVAGGRVSREAMAFFQNRIERGLAAAGPLDGLALQLHGACAGEGVDDVEGDQAALCRRILGPHVPIVLGLDHHANITSRMIENVDAIVAHRTQPHDTFDTGQVGAAVLIRLLTEKLRPVMAWRKIPLLSHQEQFLTSKGPMKRWFDRAREVEAENPAVIQVANFPMQPWLDVAEGGWSTVVTTDGDPALAERLADELADLAWSMRDDFQEREAVSVDEAVMRADAASKGVVVISDTGDTVFGGSAGDSNVILEAMLRLGIKGPALVPMISPAAARQLHEAGEGATVTLPLGGDAAPEFFTPLEVTGTVRKTGGGVVEMDYNHQPRVDIGKAVLFEVGPVTLLITEKRGVAGNLPDAYRVLDLEPAEYKIAVVKTASNFQYFAPMASALIRADTRGPGQSDVFTLPWKRIPRPVYPLERFTDWRSHSSQPGPGSASPDRTQPIVFEKLATRSVVE
jgi:microcystin degradation protein MlrC